MGLSLHVRPEAHGRVTMPDRTVLFRMACLDVQEAISALGRPVAVQLIRWAADVTPGMEPGRNTSPESGRAKGFGQPLLIRNTFAPSCEAEYLTPKQLLTMCRFGFPIDDLPPEARRIADEMIDRYIEGIEGRRRSGKTRPRAADSPTIRRIRDTIWAAAPPGGTGTASRKTSI